MTAMEKKDLVLTRVFEAPVEQVWKRQFAELGLEQCLAKMAKALA